jgi:hypothetical protein
VRSTKRQLTFQMFATNFSTKLHRSCLHTYSISGNILWIAWLERVFGIRVFFEQLPTTVGLIPESDVSLLCCKCVEILTREIPEGRGKCSQMWRDCVLGQDGWSLAGNIVGQLPRHRFGSNGEALLQLCCDTRRPGAVVWRFASSVRKKSFYPKRCPEAMC